MPELLEVGEAGDELMKDCPMLASGHCAVKRVTETDFTAGSSNFTLHSRCVFKRLWVN